MDSLGVNAEHSDDLVYQLVDLGSLGEIQSAWQVNCGVAAVYVSVRQVEADCVMLMEIFCAEATGGIAS